MNIICQYCGREFHAKPSQVRNGKKYCCKACHDAAQFKGEIKSCYECGRMIKVHPSGMRDRNFCCNQCRLAWLSRHAINEMNVPGHSAGHKAPHLTELNLRRNPLLAIERDEEKRGLYRRKQHRKLMEKALGRKLEPDEDVHHKNGIHSDNRIENLEVINHVDHLKLHWEIAKEKGVVKCKT